MDLDALDRVQRLPAFPGLKSGWSSELSPRAGRVTAAPSLRETPVDEVRIEVFDVSAHLVETSSPEVAETSDALRSQPQLANGRLGARLSSLGQSQGSGRLGRNAAWGAEVSNVERSKYTEAGLDLHRRRQEILSQQGVETGTAGLQTVAMSFGEALNPASGHSNHFSPSPSCQDNAMVDCLIPRHDSRTNGTSPCHTLLDSGPSFRSKTPPRIKVPLRAGGEKQLSPTQSLPVIPNGFRGSRCYLNGDCHVKKEHVVNIPANYINKANGIRKDDERLHHSNGYVSETGQARVDRQPPPIKASSKKPPRCPTSHSGLSSDSGHHSQHGRRRRESAELEKSKAKRGAGAAKWKMRLVTAILLACFTTLVYFQVFYMRPQQLQAILEGATQKEVLRAGLGNPGKRNMHGEGMEGLNGSNTTGGTAGGGRRLLGRGMVGGVESEILEGGTRWAFGQGSNRHWEAVFQGIAAHFRWSRGGGERFGRRPLAEEGGQRHERISSFQPREGIT